MENYDQYDGVAGRIPEFGAIFMSNLLTKKECLERKMFALPSSKAQFVKHVKTGMVLFLFESEKRQLYGVFRASSDGAMDIVPNAFSYSGKHFPAQVYITQIWYCDPLSEREFRNAIKENYFSAKKFNFGLSEDQVRRLLSLFSSRKRHKVMAHRPLPEADIGIPRKDRRSVGDGKFESFERRYTESTENDGFRCSVFPEFHDNSLVKEDEVLMDDRVNYDGIAYPLVQGDFLSKSKRRRVDDDDRFLGGDVADVYNGGLKDTCQTDCLRDSLDELRKLAAVRKLLRAERLWKENQVDKIRNAVLPSESFMIPFDVRADDDDDKFEVREQMFDEYEMDSSSLSVLYEKYLDSCKHSIDDDNFPVDGYVLRNQNIRDRVEPMVCGDGNVNLRRQAMQVIENNQSPFSGHMHDPDLLNGMKEPTSGGWFTVHDRRGPQSSEDLHSAKSSQPLHHGHRIINDSKHPFVEEHMSWNVVGSTCCSATMTSNAGYLKSGHDRVDDGKFRASERADSQNDIHTRIGTNISLGGFPLSCNQTSSLSAFSDTFLPEKGGPSQLNVSPSFAPFRVTVDDATITRSTPYSLDHPAFSHEFSNKGLPPNDLSDNQSFLHHEATSSSLNNNFPMHLDTKASDLVNHRGPLFSKSFLDRPASGYKYSEEGGALFSHPSKPNQHRVAFDDKIPTESQHTSQLILPQGANILSGKDFICSEAKGSTIGISCPEKYLTGYGYPYFGNPSCMNHQVNRKLPEALHHNSHAKRKSVFSRLTSTEELRGGKEIYIERDSDFGDYYMDATPDEVMEMLQQENNPSPRKLKETSRVVGQSKLGESTFNKKQVQANAEIIRSGLENKKVTDAAHLSFFDESITEVLKETRDTDFKRRSQTRRNSAGSGTDSISCNKTTGANEEAGKSVKTTLKRRKLVRPIFGKAESATDIFGKAESATDKLLVHCNEKQVEQNCEEAISASEARKLDDNTRPNSNVVSHDFQVCCIKEHLSPEKNDVETHVLPSLSNEPEKPKTSAMGTHVEEKPYDITRPNSTLVSHDFKGCNIKEQSSLEQNDAEALVLASLSNEPEEPITSALGTNVKPEKPIDIISPNCALVSHNCTDCRVLKQLSPEEQNGATAHVLSFSSNEPEEHKTSSVGILVEAEKPNDITRPNSIQFSQGSMNCDAKEHSSTEEKKTPFSSNEPEEQKTLIVAPHVGGSHAPLKETSPLENIANIQSFIEYMSSKNAASTIGTVILEEPSCIGSEVAAAVCSGNVNEETRPRMVKRKKKIIKKVIRKVTKTNKTGTGPTQ